MSSKKEQSKSSSSPESLNPDRFKYEVAQEMGLSNRNKLASKSSKSSKKD